MKKLMALVATSFAALSLSFASVAPVSAQATFAQNNNQRDRVIVRYCDANPYLRDCIDWRRNHNRWDDSRYRLFYRNHTNGIDALVGGILGFAAAATLFGLATNGGNVGGPIYLDQGSDHISRCQARFRSYDVASDTYLGYDGLRHRCRL